MYELIQRNEKELKKLSKKELINKVLHDASREQNYIDSYRDMRKEYEFFKKRKEEELSRIRQALSMVKASANILESVMP